MSLLALAFAACLVSVEELPKQPKNVGFPYRFQHVDRDAVLVARDRAHGQERIALYGVKIEHEGAARLELQRLIGRWADFYLEYEPKASKWHVGDRVAYVWEGRRLLNVALVRSGLARPDERGLAGKYGDYFRAAESEAKRLQRGIWSPG
jgi:endonuclease YncB( thermonuclease family)